MSLSMRSTIAVLLGAIFYTCMALLLPEMAMAKTIPEIFKTGRDWALACIGSIFIVLVVVGAIILSRQRKYPLMVLELGVGFFLAYLIFAPESATTWMKSVGVDLFN